MLILALNVLSGQVFAASPVDNSTLCTDEEYSYFSCRIVGGDQIASICGKGLDEEGDINGNTLLSYRQGPFGGRFFNYPPNAAPISSGKFLGEHMKPHGEAYESKAVIFRDMNTEYTVEIVDSSNSFVGVVEVTGKRILQYPCVSGTVTQSLLTLIQSLPPGGYK